MGRPFKTLTPAQTAEVETLAAVLTVAQMADYFGIGRTTFFSLMDRDPDVAARYKKGKARAIGTIAQSLIAKARGGDTTSMIFFLKTQAGWRETSAIEHSGPEGGPVLITSAREELTVALDRIAERIRLSETQVQERAASASEHRDGDGRSRLTALMERDAPNRLCTGDTIDAPASLKPVPATDADPA